MQENILGQEKIYRLFWKYSVPTVMGMLLLGVNVVIDGFFVGNYAGMEALASVNLATPFFSLMMAAGVIIGIGAQSAIGLAMGGGRGQEADDIFVSALLLIGGMAVLFCGCAVGASMTVAAWLGASDGLLPMVAQYIWYNGWFLPLLGMMLVLDYVLKLLGRPLYAMFTLVTSIGAHIILNYVFLVQWSAGIRGVALAAGLAYTVSFILAMLPFWQKDCALSFRRGRFNWRLGRQVLYNGSAEGIVELATGITTLLFNLTLMKYVGEMGVAAFTVIGYLAFIGNNMMLGLSDGVGAIISYNHGSGRMDRVREVWLLTLAAAGGIGVLLCSAISLSAPFLAGIFMEREAEAILTFTAEGARLYAWAFVPASFNIVCGGYFTAVGRPLPAAVIAAGKGMVFVAAGLLLWPQLWGIKGIWLAVPLAETMALLVSGCLLWQQRASLFVVKGVKD